MGLKKKHSYAPRCRDCGKGIKSNVVFIHCASRHMCKGCWQKRQTEMQAERKGEGSIWG